MRGTEEIPLEWGGKLVFINSIVGGSIDARFLPAIMKGIMSRMEQGPLTGSYARDVRVIVYDGKMPSVKPLKMPVRRFWNRFMMWKCLFRLIGWEM